MRIFLTGATGYIGSAVLDALVRAGHDVTALVRDPVDEAWPVNPMPHAEWRRGRLFEQWRAAVRN